jgi:hypothetical protein
VHTLALNGNQIHIFCKQVKIRSMSDNTSQLMDNVDKALPYPEGDNRQQHHYPTNLHSLCVEMYLPYPEGDNRHQHPCPTNLHDFCVERMLVSIVTFMLR